MKTPVKIVMSMFAILCLSVCSVNAGPQMTLSENEYDFGIIPQKASVSHTFWIKSSGSDTLRILKVVPGCGCTKMPLDKRVLAPGDSTKLELIFNSRTYNKKVKRSPSIVTNEGLPNRRITFSADVFEDNSELKPLVFTPPILKFDSMSQDKIIKFDITNSSSAVLNIKVVDIPSEYLSISIPQSIGAGEKVSGLIKLLDLNEKSKFTKSITFEVGTDKTRYTLPINF